ncbi:MAG TPA: pyrimidine/purine nucleotide monophosphate nucleosidase domain-containing protein, partial [Xanthomonadales bacterium]|nr:pyrimidine/purine nucleotide monophosphate nucleosidase domain-containing protein [Xanthomonadales bacterium]
ATIAHAKQRINDTRYIGITEPGIIAAESPNPIVNHLVIMPDIEKRLESFVRVGHAIIVFPGGVGTAEEILYLLGILLHPDNARVPFPVVFTGPKDSAAYFEQIDAFLKLVLGESAAERYRIIVGDPVEVARHVKQGMAQVTDHRVETKDAFFYNWTLKIPDAFQYRFTPTHAAMAELQLHRGRPVHELAADLRRAFSGIVAGNVKEEGIRAIEAHGPYEISGEPAIMEAMDALLKAFVEQHRMKLPGSDPYKPCYRLKPAS